MAAAREILWRLALPAHDLSAAADPPKMPCWVPCHELVRLNRLGYYRTGGDHRIAPDRVATDDRGIGSDRRPLTYQSGYDLPGLRFCSREHVVREHGAGPHEHSILQGHSRINRHVVLDLAAIAYHGTGVDEHVLAKSAPGSHTGARPDMRVMPDLGSIAHLCTVFHHSGGVDERPSSGVDGAEAHGVKG